MATEPWTRSARPARTGRTCFHLNADGGAYTKLCGKDIRVCTKCGASKRAGDDRLASGDVDRKMPVDEEGKGAST